MDPPSITKAPIISSSFRAIFSFLTYDQRSNTRAADNWVQFRGGRSITRIRNNDKKEGPITHEDPFVDQLD